MNGVGDINELSKVLKIKVSKIRNWSKHKIFVPVTKDDKNGKTLLYNIEGERFKYDIARKLTIDFSLDDIGKRFQIVFGKRNEILLETLSVTQNRNELEKKYIDEINKIKP
jgi:DNA-binding transcriptional MerR regulator